jgi:hypothetical protein
MEKYDYWMCGLVILILMLGAYLVVPWQAIGEFLGWTWVTLVVAWYQVVGV